MHLIGILLWPNSVILTRLLAWFAFLDRPLMPSYEMCLSIVNSYLVVGRTEAYRFVHCLF